MARVAAGWAGVILGLSAGACFVKPDAPPGSDPTGDGGTQDGAGNDALVTPCAIRDAFEDTGAPCGGWGFQTGSAGSGGSANQNVYRNGVLMMTSTINGGIAGCEAANPIPFTRVAVALVNVVQGSGAHTGIELRFSNNAKFRVEVQGSDGRLVVHDGTQMTYSAFSSPYVKLVRNTSSISVESSADGASWQDVSTHGVAAPLDVVTISLFTEFGSNTSYRVGSFDNLDGCAL